MRRFVKIKSSRTGEITLSVTDEGKSCNSREFLGSQICLLTLFAKIKFSRIFYEFTVQCISFYNQCQEVPAITCLLT